jgi:hypothetical protein
LIVAAAAIVMFATFFVRKHVYRAGSQFVELIRAWFHPTPRDESIQIAKNPLSQDSEDLASAGDYGAIDAEDRAAGGGTDDEASGEDQPLPWWKRFLGIYQ